MSKIIGLVEEVMETRFIDTFLNSDERKNQFTYEALKELYKYYENLSKELDEQIQFDMIGICCDWTEYAESEFFNMFQSYGNTIEEIITYFDSEEIIYKTIEIERMKEDTTTHYLVINF